MQPQQKKFLSASDIIAKDDFRYEDVDMTEEWGGFVRIRDLSAADRTEFLDGVELTDEGAVKDFRALLGLMPRLIARVAVDPGSGQLLFKSEEQVTALARKSAKAVTKLFNAVVKLAGLTDDAVDEAGKGSGETENGGSSSDSALH